MWSDEFDGSAGELVDSSNWSYDIGRGVDGWGNQELQFYRDVADNVSLTERDLPSQHETLLWRSTVHVW